MAGEARAQSRSFGEVAEAYDRVRPAYPQGAVSLLAERGGRGQVLELGAGTGKLTRLLAPGARRLVALEPDGSMAAVGRAHLGDRVEWVERAFEQWPAPSAAFDLAVSAQAWHWLDPATRLERTAAALAPGGWLALLWNRPEPVADSLRAAIDAAYDRHAPAITGRAVGTPPSSCDQPSAEDELARTPLFGSPDTQGFAHSVRYRTDEYRLLLDTMSDCRMLEPERREALLDELCEAIDAHGGSVEIRYQCRVVTAQRT